MLCAKTVSSMDTLCLTRSHTLIIDRLFDCVNNGLSKSIFDTQQRGTKTEHSKIKVKLCSKIFVARKQRPELNETITVFPALST